MFKNYLKIGWRNLVKNKAYSAINILGLSIGMAVALLIAMWILNEVTFNNYHKNHATLGQVMTTQTFNGETGTGEAVAMPLGNELRTKYGQDFKNVSMASWNFTHVLAAGDTKISADGMWVESNFPEMFSLKMIKGDIAGLKDPSSILLNESVAKALFGKQEAIGKMVRVDNQDSYKVVGVYEDLPRNTTLNETKILLSWNKYITTEQWLRDAATQWNNHSWQAFAEVNNAANMRTISDKIKNASMIHKNEATEGKEELVLLPMDDWRLNSEFKNGKQSGGRIQYVWLFGIIGVFVLVLACINFMNLSTARSEKRAREVGIRKAIGSQRRQLILQFISESMLISFIAMIISIIMVQLMLPFFNSMADKQMSIPYGNVFFWLLMIVFAFFTGIIAGSYPAFYLSKFNPVTVLKGTFKAGPNASLPRKILVVLQFTVSIALVIGTIIVFRQIQFAKDRPVGYTRQGLIMVDMTTKELYDHYEAIHTDLLSIGVIESAAKSSSPATAVYSNQIGFSWAGKDPSSLPLFGTIAVDWDFGKTVKWHIKEGRDYSRDFKMDTSSLLLNEAAVKLVGIKDILGKVITKDSIPFTVIGVVKDMVMESPYSPIQPTVFFLNPQWANVITMRIKPSVSMQTALAKIEPVFRRYNPGSPFNYKFTDEEYAKKFADEQRIGNLATFFAALAIFISCLGLFGLASFVAEQRTKEIGIRKILGASVLNLWGMLSVDFLKLVLISACIAVPIAWWGLYEWLQKYEYRTTISWWIFIAAILGSALITILTVSFQAIRAALANPVNSLRSE